MSDTYILLSDFSRNGMESGNLVEGFAEILDKLLNDETKLNKITPIYVARGGYGNFSLEPLFFTYFNGNPLIFSTAYRLAGEDEGNIDDDSYGEQFIYEVFNTNNNYVYDIGPVNSDSDIDAIFSEVRSGNVRLAQNIDNWMVLSLILQNKLAPVAKLDLPNGGMLDVYEFSYQDMDAVTLDKNFNNGQITLVDYDNRRDIKFLIAVGGNPIIRNIGMFSDSHGFVYTAWTKNEPQFFRPAMNMIEWFPFDLIEPDITDMSMAIGEHIILHRRENQMAEAEENMNSSV